MNAALSQPVGAQVVCEAVIVDRIAARQDPPYLVIRDFRSRGSKLAVLVRPPISLRPGQCIRVVGTTGVLPDRSERYIHSATISGYYDRKGDPLHWAPIPDILADATTQVLPVPTDAVAPSDPGLPYYNNGIAGAVSAEGDNRISRYATVASLLASEPAVLTRVELSAKPIVEVGTGYIVVGDDGTGATVKVYATAEVRPGDRLLKLTATVHTEQARMCLYAGSGVSPYFDAQGTDALGGVSVARPGSVAYAATVGDSTTTAARTCSGSGTLDAGIPIAADGSWVYLTGQVVTASGFYCSYEASEPGGRYIYYAQGLDRTPGIRVWDADSGYGAQPGYIVDIMAQLDTKDGERILGLTDPADPTSVELKVWNTSNSVLPRPVLMTNRALCGASFGLNPGVSNPFGLYNVGSVVKICGEVLQSGYEPSLGIPYLRVHDGSTQGGGTGGVVVFDTTYLGLNQFSTGDRVIVTGVSSIYKPDGATDTYRAVWTPISVQGAGSLGTGGGTTGSGAVSGTVTLYDMDTASAEVTICSSEGASTTVTVTAVGNVGAASYSLTGLPALDESSGPVQYLVSAKSAGYKTRTYAGVTTGTTKDFHLTPLRKISLSTSQTTYSIDACSNDSVAITAKVVDSEHNPMVYDPGDPAPGSTVRFSTTAGSFSPSSVVQAASAHTNAFGEATVTLYARGPAGTATVAATDDATTPVYASCATDVYRCDWEALAPNIAVYQAPRSLQLAISPPGGASCASRVKLTATLQVCGMPRAGELVTFHTTAGTFLESGTNSAQVATDAEGIATVTLIRPTCGNEPVSVYAECWPYSLQTVSNTVITTGRKLEVEVKPYWTMHDDPVDVEATLTDDLGPVAGEPVTLTTDYGTFDPHDPGNSQSYTANTDAGGHLNTTLTVSECPVIATVTATNTSCGGGCVLTATHALKVLCQQPAPCEIFFCLDSTGSMGGVDGPHRATASVAQFLDDLVAEGVQFKTGGVKFNEPPTEYEVYEEILTEGAQSQFASLGAYGNVPSFISGWVGNGYEPVGGDDAELQLDALHLAAEDMEDHATPSNPNRYIVLVTDNVYHENDYHPTLGGSEVTKSEVVTRLVQSGCRVYISVWDPYALLGLEDLYQDLAVAGEFDDAEYAPGTPAAFLYPLRQLRARILSSWPSE